MMYQPPIYLCSANISGAYAMCWALGQVLEYKEEANS